MNIGIDAAVIIEDDDTSETVAFKVKAEEHLYAADTTDYDDDDNNNNLKDDQDTTNDNHTSNNHGTTTTTTTTVAATGAHHNHHHHHHHEFFSSSATSASSSASAMLLPNVPFGKEFMFLLRKRQPFLKVFQHYQKKHGLKKERLELRFHDKLLSEEDTPYSVQMEQNDTVFVRTCRNPDIVFKVKAEEDLFSETKQLPSNDDDNNDALHQHPQHNHRVLCLSEGQQLCMSLRNTQRFSTYLFKNFHKDLRRDDLEFRFGLKLLKEEDTPSSIQLQTNDTIWVRKCRNPKPVLNIQFEVKAEEDLYSDIVDKDKESVSPDVYAGQHYFFLLRKTQAFQKVFTTFYTLHEDSLKRTAPLEFRFGGRVLNKRDTPNSVGLRPDDIILVRNRMCRRNPKRKFEEGGD